MSFFAVKNLTEKTVAPVVPWEFAPVAKISEQVRESKQDRQEWYQNADTVHQFYTGLEGMNNNMRVSKENPPLKAHAIVADYDLNIEEAMVNRAIETMKVKPSWVERSLGNNVRLVWQLDAPLVVGDSGFYSVFAEELKSYLKLDLLPDLDMGAFTNATRLYANGCKWRKTGHGPVSLQAPAVSASRKFKFAGKGTATIPLDLVEKEIRKRWPNWEWPSEFVPGSQGPSWWIPESVSPMSAIVKPEGMITFSAHALKVFYSWADILGSEFVKGFMDDAIGNATKDVYFDGKNYHWKLNGYYSTCSKPTLEREWKIKYRLSNKPDKETGMSPMDLALNFVETEHFVDFAAPSPMQRPGITILPGWRQLNTYGRVPMNPACGSQKFGPFGNFPFISDVFTHLFDPIEKQLLHINLWFQYFYQACLEWKPFPGQNIVLSGASGIGKTLLGRLIFGPAVGGFADASKYLMENNDFNADLLNSPLWCLDDDTPDTQAAMRRFHIAFKKVASNLEVRYNQKYEKAGKVEFPGRIAVTTNLDPISLRVIGQIDDGTKQKINIYRCSERREFSFPGREETIKHISTELPYYLRWNVDLKNDGEFPTHDRYGIESYQNAELLDQTFQVSVSAPFKEVLIAALTVWFKEHPEAKEWVGPVSKLVDLISVSFSSPEALRAVGLDHANRHMEAIKREGILKCESEVGPMKTRVWKIKRF